VSPLAINYDADGGEDLVIRHQPTGRVWALRGSSGSLAFLGTLASGFAEGEWLIDVSGDSPGLLMLIRT
jgi:hypothetical protein